MFVYEEILGLRYQLKSVQTMKAFRDLLASSQTMPDLVIADLRLPDESFLNFLSSADRRKLDGVPIFVVSSLDDLDILRASFESGAVDYLTKPFKNTELIVKVERMIQQRQTARNKNDQNFVIDPVSLTISRSNLHSVPLTSKEFQIVTLLQQAPNHTIRKEDLVARIWGRVKTNTNSLEVHLSNLRKKIAPLGLELFFRPPNLYTILPSTNEVASQQPVGTGTEG